MPEPVKGRTHSLDYAAVDAALGALPALVRARIDYLGLSYREVGRQAGVSFSTVHRFVEGGNDPSFRAARLLFRWLGATEKQGGAEAEYERAVARGSGPRLSRTGKLPLISAGSLRRWCARRRVPMPDDPKHERDEHRRLIAFVTGLTEQEIKDLGDVPDQSGRSLSRSTTAPANGCDQQFVADVLHDCLSSFQNIEGDALTFDRDGAVEYLLSPASGLRIEVDK